jgi:hypothetical protein
MINAHTNTTYVASVKRTPSGNYSLSFRQFPTVLIDEEPRLEHALCAAAEDLEAFLREEKDIPDAWDVVQLTSQVSIDGTPHQFVIRDGKVSYS